MCSWILGAEIGLDVLLWGSSQLLSQPLWDAQEHFPALKLFQSFHLGGGKNSGRKEEFWVPMSVQVQL